MSDGDSAGAARVLVVDDDVHSVELIEALLEMHGYTVCSCLSGLEAVPMVHREEPDVVLLDVTLPGVSGYAICLQLKADERTRLIPIIMITALSSMEDRIRGIESGADDFLSKPVSRIELLTRIKSLVRVKRLNEDLESATNIILTLATALEASDQYTRGHSERVANLSVALGKALGLSEDNLRTLRFAGLLHDLGKIGIKDSILNKPGRLSPEELAYVRTHAVIGERICHPLRILRPTLPMIRSHGERYDGTGMPDGLKGQEIDLGARIIAVVDAFDAMTSDRPYRRAMNRGDALRLLLEGAGVQWDPQLVELFVDVAQCPSAASVDSGDVQVFQRDLAIDARY